MGKMKRGMGDPATHAPRPLPYDWQLPWLERQPNTRSQRVGVVRVLLPGQVGRARRRTVRTLGSVECVTCKQPAAHEIEVRIRGEPPGEPEIPLGPEIVGVTLHKAVLVDGPPCGGADAGGGRDLAGGIGVDGLRGPHRVDDPVHAQRGRDVVCGPAGEPDATVAVVADPGAGPRPALVEVVNPGGPELAPAAAPVGAVRVEWLVVPNPPGQVVASFVARGVHAAGLEQQRTELVATDDVGEEG